ncbi:MAG: transglutaminase domain-containing protein, partial [Deltaproteobacteria bacterium]|nr:transglutaminase domain-containing protein [Deltaproteobacteria bacterium]
MSCNNTKNTNRKITGSLLPENSKAYILLYIFFIMVAFSGCAANQILKVDTINIDNFSPYELPDGSKIYPASIDHTVPDVDILAINDEIKALLNQKIKKIRNPAQRIEKLSEILVSKIMYDTAGDAYGVQTAQETFDSGTGNCLSFTNLFVAMARYSGLRPRFSEIPTLPNWTRDGEILFFTRHIGASVDILH